MPSEALRTARAILGVLTAEAEKAEKAITALLPEIEKDDESLALGLMAQAKALKLAAEEAEKLMAMIGPGKV